MNTTDWLGFIGVFLILLAYILNILDVGINSADENLSLIENV